MKKFIPLIIIAALLALGAYYWFFMRATQPTEVTSGEPQGTSIFNPFRRGTVTTPPVNTTQSTSTSITQTPVDVTPDQIGRLRQLSVTPVGGFVASTTASSSVARYVDRGVGHVYEAQSASTVIDKITNTTIPRVYESYWNKNGNLAVMRYMKDSAGPITNFFAEIKKIPSTPSSTPAVPYEVKGKFLSGDIHAVAVSPKGDRIVTWNIEEGKNVVYVSGFDESKKTRVIESPLSQVSLEWPEENTLAVTTNASGVASGFLYFVDLRKPTFTKILGGITGLTTKVSRDGARVIYSSTNSRGLVTNLYTVKTNTHQEVIFRTLAEKCVWSKLRPTEAYCAVPVELPRVAYPDDWYRGNISFADQLWHFNSLTGEVSIVANLTGLSQTQIDVINPTLDPKEEYLYFMNKKDLTLWSFDLKE